MTAGGRTAAVVTVGTELLLGINVDTNAADVAAALTAAGYAVGEMASLRDDVEALSALLARLCARYALVVVTGGLGPTHDDVTRDAASRALGLPLVRDESIAGLLRPVAERHADASAAAQVYRQADVLEGATVLLPEPGIGTAPGQVVPTPAGRLVLLPGPPPEMRPMLAAALAGERVGEAPVVLGVVGGFESDAQITAQAALAGVTGVGLTVLATPGEVRVVLTDEGAGEQGLEAAAGSVRAALGATCLGRATLAEAVIDAARSAGVTLAAAESCTGGLVSARLTDVPGASDVFLGGAVTYADSAKTVLLEVPEGMLAQFGAVSEEVARAMAEGAVARFGAGLAVAVTGIAGPGGGSDAKPVGLVWFAVADRTGSHAESRMLHGDRGRIRARAAVVALELLRSALADAAARP